MKNKEKNKRPLFAGRAIGCGPPNYQLLSSQVMKIKRSVSFKVPAEEENKVKESEIDIETTRSDELEDLESGSHKHEAATKLQKVYKIVARQTSRSGARAGKLAICDDLDITMRGRKRKESIVIML
nr:hypothetical protein [Tanacetum cinerariifolium]